MPHSRPRRSDWLELDQTSLRPHSRKVRVREIRQGSEKRQRLEAGEYGWLSNLQAGQAEARKTGKPLMVVLRCVP